MDDYTDDVRGVVIGGDGVRYEFWTEDAEPCYITWGTFRTDAEAVAWFHAEHPDAFARGAEMRVFDRRSHEAL
jgi:hypothetical protein